ncbi:MAG: alpha-galactosidase [Phycisphaerales bacterium]
MAEINHGPIEHSKKQDIMIATGSVSRHLKIVFLGAGSFFLDKLFVDILNMSGAEKGEMYLVDIDGERLELARKIGEKIVQCKGSDWKIKSTKDRKEALPGADYVINCIEVNGVECVHYDYDIPAKYGIYQCIGDTIGPGGLFKALRTVPVFLNILKDVEELCPDALVLNYTNPMSIMCLAAVRASKVKVVGLCHSVQGTSRCLANYLGVPYENLRWDCAGVNHLSWFTKLTCNGQDLYPQLRKKVLAEKALYEKDPVKFDMMLHFGYFITETSGHLSEYLPYYRKRPDLIKKYCREGFLGESRYYANNWLKWRKDCDTRRLKRIQCEEEIPMERSWEYGSYVIQAIESDVPCVIYGTVPNTGLIENLPIDGAVEVACLVNRNGIKPAFVGKLPAQCAAICDWNMRMYDLAATACIEKSRQAAIHALMLDPLTSAVCCPAEINQMAEELFDAQKQFLPDF